MTLYFLVPAMHWAWMQLQATQGGTSPDQGAWAFFNVSLHIFYQGRWVTPSWYSQEPSLFPTAMHQNTALWFESGAGLLSLHKSIEHLKDGPEGPGR